MNRPNTLTYIGLFLISTVVLALELVRESVCSSQLKILRLMFVSPFVLIPALTYLRQSFIFATNCSLKSDKHFAKQSFIVGAKPPEKK